jgi:hypothetical protein
MLFFCMRLPPLSKAASRTRLSGCCAGDDPSVEGLVPRLRPQPAPDAARGGSDQRDRSDYETRDVLALPHGHARGAALPFRHRDSIQKVDTGSGSVWRIHLSAPFNVALKYTDTHFIFRLLVQHYAAH